MNTHRHLISHPPLAGFLPCFAMRLIRGGLAARVALGLLLFTALAQGNTLTVLNLS